MAINFTPNMGEYRELKPFRFWCQKILPIVYDDSLSYYELLNKVVDYLNKTMEDVDTLHDDVENLHTAYTQLQDYVNHYFDNLDVTEEINNKLDDMAQTGVLTALVSPLIPDLVTDWLDENISGEATVTIDKSMTISGSVPDAQIVGDTIYGYVNGITKTFTIPASGTHRFEFPFFKGAKYVVTNNTNNSCTFNVIGVNGEVSSYGAISAGSTLTFEPTQNRGVALSGWFNGSGTITVSCNYSNLYDYRLLPLYDYGEIFDWEIGSIYSNNIDWDEASFAIRTPSTKKVYLANDCVIESTNPLINMVYAFKYSNNGSTFEGRLGDGTKSVEVQGGYWYRVAMIADLDTVITSGTIANYSAKYHAGGELLHRILDKVRTDYPYEVGTVIDSSLLQNVVGVERVGSGVLLYKQSFLIKDGKYYSTNGSRLAVQSSDFTVETDNVVEVGHGNSFMLGADGRGYISGWDDDTVYVLNLDTLAVVDTIVLPTSGYTTCAINTDKHVLYIFQRNTMPTTESLYNFIVYDYQNENIIDTFVTSVPFAAMQACDLWHDRIFVANGVGNAQAPNGFRVYNTRGEILADYYLPTFDGIEPEGVCIDGANGNIYISDVDGKVYKLHDV